jgi:hypothetical protein
MILSVAGILKIMHLQTKTPEGGGGVKPGICPLWILKKKTTGKYIRKKVKLPLCLNN